jgi:SAM-dependent methyltransferase
MTQSWWTDFYDDAFTDVTGDIESDAQINAHADFIIKELGLKQGDTLFDQCCGKGRLSRAFAPKGIHVIGVDQSAHYIDAAKQADPDGAYFAGDAFEFITSQPCDAAINWWTSFGFFADDAKNIIMLKRMLESLKDGAMAAIEYSNAAYDIKHFRPVSDYHNALPAHLKAVSREYTLDLDRGMRGSIWHYTYADGRTTSRFGESRLYMPQDIALLLTRAGFENAHIVNVDSITHDTPRFICTARKPL